VALALPGFGAAAADGPQDFGNVDNFERICVENGGIFTDTRDGNTWCQLDGGFQIVCDENGNDCYDIEMQLPTNPYSVDPIYGIWTPVTEPTPPVAEDPIIADPDLRDGGDERDARTPDGATQKALASNDDQDQHHDTSKKGKKGKHGKKGGKHRKR
jgi:hypothetical protein